MNNFWCALGLVDEPHHLSGPFKLASAATVLIPLLMFTSACVSMGNRYGNNYRNRYAYNNANGYNNYNNNYNGEDGGENGEENNAGGEEKAGRTIQLSFVYAWSLLVFGVVVLIGTKTLAQSGNPRQNLLVCLIMFANLSFLCTVMMSGQLVSIPSIKQQQSWCH